MDTAAIEGTLRGLVARSNWEVQRWARLVAAIDEFLGEGSSAPQRHRDTEDSAAGGVAPSAGKPAAGGGLSLEQPAVEGRTDIALGGEQEPTSPTRGASRPGAPRLSPTVASAEPRVPGPNPNLMQGKPWLTREARAEMVRRRENGETVQDLVGVFWPIQGGGKMLLNGRQIRKALSNERRVRKTEETKGAKLKALVQFESPETARLKVLAQEFQELEKKDSQGQDAPDTVHGQDARATDVVIEEGDNPAEFLSREALEQIRKYRVAGWTWKGIAADGKYRMGDGVKRFVSAGRLQIKFEAQMNLDAGKG